MVWAGIAIWLWATVTACVALGHIPWWKSANLYQVYPRSLYDSQGNGIGNFKGITEKVPYLRDIGVTAVWLSPIFKSPMADLGYDIADYRTVDPTFGTNDDFIELIKLFNEAGIKILLDLVPNHTSDEHEWFQKSVKREDPYTDYYVWVDGKTDPATGEKVPPNNWVSNFSGGAWEWNEQRRMFYLHQFLVKQPDLNYRNPRVVEEMDEVILFWLDQGVDGFRVDAVPFMFEDKELRDNPVKDGVITDTYSQNQPETYELIRHWAELVHNYSLKDGRERALFIEAYASLENTVRYYGEDKLGLVQPFNFMLLTKLSQKSGANDYKDVIMSWIDSMPAGAAANWVIGNHDNSRAANRYGKEMVDALNMLTGVLPGNKVTYYGEEIGMEDTFVRWDQTVDPAGKLLGPDNYQKASRDPERSPMQWDDSDNAGFSTNPKTWLPVNPNYWCLNVDAQNKTDISHLKVYQKIMESRKDPVLLFGDVSVIVHDEDTLVVKRSYEEKWYVLVINLAANVVRYNSVNFFAKYGLDSFYTVVAVSSNAGLTTCLTLETEGKNTSIALRPKAAILLQSMTPAK